MKRACVLLAFSSSMVITAEHFIGAPLQHQSRFVLETALFPAKQNSKALTTDLTQIDSCTCSLKNCEKLGWDSGYDDSDVCVSSVDVLGKCSGRVSFDEATQFCESSGARLCAIDELLELEKRSSSCGYCGVF